MPSDKPPTRWARELDEDGLRRAREKGPGGITYVSPLHREDGLSGVLYLLLTVLTGAMGFALGFVSRAIFDLVLSVL